MATLLEAANMGPPRPETPGKEEAEGVSGSEASSGSDASGWADLDDRTPMEKIIQWKPKKRFRHKSLIPVTEADKIIGKPWDEKAIPPWKSNYWRKYRKWREHSCYPEEKGLEQYRKYEQTPDDMKLINFLVDCLKANRQQLSDFRSFDYCTAKLKNREVFDPQAFAVAPRKLQRMVWKLAAELSIRGAQDVLQLTETDWIRGHLPLQFVMVKKKLLEWYYEELSDLERAQLWLSVGETQQQRSGHGLSLSFPFKETPCYVEDGIDSAATGGFRAPVQAEGRYKIPPPQAYQGWYRKELEKESMKWIEEAKSGRR